MEINEYLVKHQPIIYNTIVNAIEKNHISHAYLLSGSPGMPLKEVALFITKSLLCEERNPLACNHCMTCLRIDEGTYLDLKVIGDKNRIKKEEVQNIIESFSNTANERAGKVIYVINYVESMTVQAVNSLLKFLEEPGQDVYAILTTENESKVLPTILSRTQVLKMRAIERDIVAKEALSLGVESEDAEILSALYNDAETVKAISEGEQYQTLKKCLQETLDGLESGKGQAQFNMDKCVVPAIKTYDSAKIYLSLLATVFQDLLNLEFKNDITLKSYDTIIMSLSRELKHISYSLRAILAAKNQLEINVNIPLLLDHVIYEITREDI